MLELADIFRAVGPGYRQKFGDRMPPSHRKAMRDIERCRTSALGGHLRECDACGERRYSYHSCRNRHCPKCHADRSRRWIAAQRARLLACPYFLLTFTLPAELRPLARSHQKAVYGLLLRAAAQALFALTADRRFLGARPGMIAVLHTWTRAMAYHPHVHFLVTAGGLTPEGSWRPCRNPNFLVPCRALSPIFRAKIRDGLEKAGLLHAGIPRKVWRHRWVVHGQHAGSGERVLDYLGRYLYRVAIANSRIESFDDGLVTFRYRDNRSRTIRRCTLPAERFLAQFLQHVLPRGFSKVRSFGLYSPTAKPSLEQARSLLQAAVPGHDVPTRSDPSFSSENPSADPLCPRCRQGHLRLVAILVRLLGTEPAAPSRAPP